MRLQVISLMALLSLVVWPQAVRAQNTDSSMTPYDAGPAMPAEQNACANLNPTEQHFALQLNPGNRALFCTQFTPDQRAAAMLKAAQPDATGNLVSPDDAVEGVAASQPMPQGPSQPSSSMPQGCPSP